MPKIVPELCHHLTYSNVSENHLYLHTKFINKTQKKITTPAMSPDLTPLLYCQNCDFLTKNRRSSTHLLQIFEFISTSGLVNSINKNDLDSEHYTSCLFWLRQQTVNINIKTLHFHNNKNNKNSARITWLCNTDFKII